MQHCTSKNPPQCFPLGSRKQCTGKNHVQCCLNTQKPMQCCPRGQHCTAKTLCNVVPEASHNIVQEKIWAILSEQNLITPFI